MNMMMKALLVAGVIGSTTVAVANTAVNQAAVAASTPTTVKHALTLKDDSHVQLKGYVVKAIGDETPVTIIGEVDIDYKPAKRVEIDVDQVKF